MIGLSLRETTSDITLCSVLVSVEPSSVSMGERWEHRSRVIGGREAVNSSVGHGGQIQPHFYL